MNVSRWFALSAVVCLVGCPEPGPMMTTGGGSAGTGGGITGSGGGLSGSGGGSTNTAGGSSAGGEGGGSAAAGGSVGGGTTAGGIGGGTSSAGGSATGGGSVMPGTFNYAFQRDSFSFENYVNENASQGFTATNLTELEVQRMFGPAVCADADAGTCVLTPAARQWMQTTNTEMNGGHCEGMAVLSALFATGTVSPQTFGGASAFALQLPQNVPLQREIAYWWALQGTEPTISSEQRRMRTPNQILADLSAGFDAGLAFTFGLYKRDGSGGHANTPYLIEPADGGVVRVRLYENNFPNDVKAVEIDTVANTWRYEATTNPQTPAEIYDGDATSKNLTITPLTSRLQPAVCPFCGEVTANGMTVRGAAVAYRELQLSGGGRLTVFTADAGTPSIFRSDAGWVNTLAQASIGSARRGPTTWDDELDPIFRLPLTTPLTVTLDGDGLSTASQASVSLVAPGYSFSVEGVSLDPGQRDTLEFSGDPRRVSYTTTGQETPVIELGVSLDGNDYVFQIIAGAETGGVTVTLVNDVPNGELRVDVDAADGNASYGVTVYRLGDDEEVFSHLANTVGSSASVFLNYGTWAGQGQPMLFEVDTNGDGTPDMSQMVSDDM
ncbi:MAG: hypothetical protein GQE15_29435 [Archangiaceae bacterium]|nr:hypothetical protein [Archangiaceae bacterium]